MSDRIRLLAEAMGWELVDRCGTKRWVKPGKLGFTGYLELPFDPETDANDCETLIRWLCSNGHSVRVDFWDCSDEPESSTVSIDGDESGDDCKFWKQGVCELALKVIESHPPGER